MTGQFLISERATVEFLRTVQSLQSTEAPYVQAMRYLGIRSDEPTDQRLPTHVLHATRTLLARSGPEAGAHFWDCGMMMKPEHIWKSHSS